MSSIDSADESIAVRTCRRQDIFEITYLSNIQRYSASASSNYIVDIEFFPDKELIRDTATTFCGGKFEARGSLYREWSQ